MSAGRRTGGIRYSVGSDRGAAGAGGDGTTRLMTGVDGARGADRFRSVGCDGDEMGRANSRRAASGSGAAGRRGKAGGHGDGHRAWGAGIGRAIAAHVTAGIVTGPSRNKQTALSSSSCRGSSGRGGGIKIGARVGGSKGGRTGAAGNIDWAAGHGDSKSGPTTASGRWQSNGDGERDGDRAQGSGNVVGSWEASADGSRCRASDSD